MRRTVLALFVILISGSLFAGQNGTPKPTAVIVTSAGDFTCELFPDKAPLTVRTFAALATGKQDWRNPKTKQIEHGKPLYNGTFFHRVIPGFMIQGGDPTGTGKGGPGFAFKDEISDLKFDRPGRLAMANAGPNSNGSQFFITEQAAPSLNKRHTIFGQCNQQSLVADIANRPRNPQTDRPFLPVIIQKIVIKDYPPATPTATPAATPTATPAVTPIPPGD